MIKPLLVKRSTGAIITKWTYRKLIALEKETITSHKKKIEVKKKTEKGKMTKSLISGRSVSQSPRAVNICETSARNGVSQSPEADLRIAETSTRISKNKMEDVQVNGVKKN